MHSKVKLDGIYYQVGALYAHIKLSHVPNYPRK